MKFINIKIFFISLFLGLFFIYVIKPNNEKIFVFPTPDNINDIQYEDNIGNCFEFEKTEVNCNKDSNNYIAQ